MHVVDALEPIDIDEGDAQWLVMTRGALDLGVQGGEQGLAVGDPGQPVVGRPHLGLQVSAGRIVEGLCQALLGRDAAHPQRDRVGRGDGPLQGEGQAVEPPADVAPRQQRHGSHACHRRHDRHDRQREATIGLRHRCDGEPDGDGGRHGERCQEPEGTNEEEHVGRMAWRYLVHHGSMVPRCTPAPWPRGPEPSGWGSVQYSPGTLGVRATIRSGSLPAPV